MSTVISRDDSIPAAPSVSPAAGDAFSHLAGRDPTRATTFYTAVRVVVWLLAKMLVRLDVRGAEHVPSTGGVLIVSNHQSNLDPPMLGVGLRRPMAFLAKSGLFKVAPFAAFIRRLNAFPVRHGAGDVGAMKEAIRLLRAGWVLTVFAEGARSFTGELQPAQKGAGLLIRRCGVPVVPAVIDGSFRAMPRGAKLLRPSKVRVRFGPPADLSAMKPDDIRAWIDQTLASMLADLRAEHTGGRADTGP